MDLQDVTVGRGTTIIDLGANEVDRFTAWAKLCELDDELVAAGSNTFILNATMLKSSRSSKRPRLRR
jgi:hypothetical protein